MIGILTNALAIIVGTAIGCIFKRLLEDKYIDALWIALGLAALGVGIQTVVVNMSKSKNPLLFIVSLAIGALLGTWWKWDEHAENFTHKKFHSEIGKGIATATFLDGIGALAILGPVQAATNGNETLLYTNAMLTLVCAIIFGAGFGWGMLAEAPILFIEFLIIFLVAKFLSVNYFSENLIVELSLVGGFLITAAGISLLKLREIKTLNLLPALLIPLIYFTITMLI